MKKAYNKIIQVYNKEKRTDSEIHHILLVLKIGKISVYANKFCHKIYV